MPASTRPRSRSWSPSATCARFPRIPSRRAPPPGRRCRPPIRSAAACSTCTAPPKAMSAGRSAGFTYLSLLIVVAITAGALAAAGGLWSHTAQREKEAELLFVGEQFRQAIALYYWRTPGGAHQFPKSLEVLLDDQRWPVTQRYLRKIYRDPITNTQEWGIVEAPGGGVMGVYSKSEEMPIKSGNFPQRYGSFAEARNYADWKFVFTPETPKTPAAPQ